MKFSSFYTLLIISILFSCQKPLQKSAEKFVPDYALNRFEKTIRAYEKADSLTGIKKGEILFYGSSSFYYWKTLQEDMAPLNVQNHAFGGSTFPELIFYADRMIMPYEPKKVVIYCENDMFMPKIKSPEQTFDDYEALIEKIRKGLPNAKIYTVSLKPSPSRKASWTTVQRVNKAINYYTKKHKNMVYIDITKAMYKPTGELNNSIFIKDSLHMNAEGYKIWTNIIKPAISN